MAEALARLGDQKGAQAMLTVAKEIDLHAYAIQNAGLYESEGFESFCARIEKLAAIPNIQKAPNLENIADLTLIAGGDLCLARQLPGIVEQHGSEWPLEKLHGRLSSADVAIVNLESVSSTLGDFLEKPERRPFYYHSPPETIDVLVKAGINVVGVANNHALDSGPSAFEQQLEILDSCGIAACGGGRDFNEAARPTYITVKNRTIAFIAVDTRTPWMAATSKKPGINYASEDKLLRLLAASITVARLHSDFVIVTPHWGPNWKESPTPSRQNIAHTLIDLGADAILGHSAHILQGVEIYRGRPIVYDMGSLLFDRVNENRMQQAALFELGLGRNGFEQLRIIPVCLNRGSAELASGEKAMEIRDLIIGLSKDLIPNKHFDRSGEDLVVSLAPDIGHHSLPRHPLPPLQSYHPSKLKEVPEFYRELPSQWENVEIPETAKFADIVKVNSWLDVCGAQWASSIHPGYGFLCEVFILAAPPPAGRWEARLSAVNSSGKVVFTYVHPVGESVPLPRKWTKKGIVSDRFIARPPSDLPAGEYKLYWHLFDQVMSKRMSCEYQHERLTNKMVFLGTIDVSVREKKVVKKLAS